MAINRHISAASIPQTLTDVNGTFTVDCLAGTNFLLDFNSGSFENDYDPIVYVGGMAKGAGGSGGLTFTFATELTGGTGNIQEGDMVIVAVAVGSASTTTGNVDITMSTAGYTELADLFASDTQQTNLAVFYKIMGATPDTTVVTAGTGSVDNSIAAAVQVWRNVDQSNPFDVAIRTDTSIDTGVATPDSITTVTENAIIVAIGASGHAEGTVTYDTPSGLSNFITASGNDAEDITVGMGSALKNFAGTFSPSAFTGPGALTSNSSAAATLALRPTYTFARLQSATINFTNPSEIRTPILVDLFYPANSETYYSSIDLVWDSDIIELISLPTSITKNVPISYEFYTQNDLIYSFKDVLSSQLQSFQKTDIVKSTGTWTAPRDVSKIEVILCGGGGGGTDSNAGGGSAFHDFLDVIPGSSYTITIGAGGAAGTGNPTSGTDSTFGALLTATGAAGRLPGGLGGYGEQLGAIDDPVADFGYYQLKISGYDENYGRGGSKGGNNGVANTGQGGGIVTTTGSSGGSGVCIIKYRSAY